MKKYIITVKLFCKTLSIIIPYILLVLCINIALFQLANAFVTAMKNDMLADAMYFFGDINIVCFFLYMFFLFIGFGYMRKIRESGMEEVFSSYGGAGMGIYIRQFSVLVLAVILVSANIAFYVLWGWKNLTCASEMLGEVIRLLLVDVLLLSLAAASMGALLSRIRNRFAGYAVIVLFLFLILPNTVSFYESLQADYHIPVFFIRDLIFLIPPDMFASPDALYGFPLENYRIAAMLLWIVAAVTMLLWKTWKKRVRMRNIITAALFVLMGVLVYETESKGSVLLMSDHPESSEQVFFYYPSHEAKSETAAFTISKYELDLKFGKELEVRSRMTLGGEAPLDEYHFTLDHAYQIGSITDQDGSPLAYSRDGDYVNIRTGGKQLTQISICYKGHSALFYASEKACFLPGFFAYYPKAGYRTVRSDYGYLYHEEPKTRFEVKTDQTGIACNLPETASGFQGEAEALTLINGYYQITDEGNHRVLSYPLMESREEYDRQLPAKLQTDVEQLKNYLGLDDTDIQLELPETVFTVPCSLSFNSHLSGYFPYEDHVILSPDADAYELLQTKAMLRLAPEKQTFYQAFFFIRPEEEAELEDFSYYSSENGFDGYLTEADELHDMCLDKIKEIGIQNFARSAIHYLLDENDHTDPFTFLNSLRKEE